MLTLFENMSRDFLRDVENKEDYVYHDFVIDLKRHNPIKVKFVIEKIARTTEKKLIEEKLKDIKKEVLQEKKIYFENLPDDVNQIIEEYKKQLEYTTYNIKINDSYAEFYGEYLLGKDIDFGDIEDISGCCGEEEMLQKIDECMCIEPEFDINTNEGLRMKKEQIVNNVYGG